MEPKRLEFSFDPDKESWKEVSGCPSNKELRRMTKTALIGLVNETFTNLAITDHKRTEGLGREKMQRKQINYQAEVIGAITELVLILKENRKAKKC